MKGIKEEPTFIINKELLFIEFYLVNVNYPECFICIDNNDNRYLVLLIDFENENYIITKTTINKLKRLICGTISIKNLFETTDDYIYSVKTSKTPIDYEDRIYFDTIEDNCGWFEGDGYYFNKQYIDNSGEYLEKLNQITTNFDKLKSMTQDEVVEYIQNGLCKIYENCNGCPMNYYGCLRDEFVEWLEKPVKEIK